MQRVQHQYIIEYVDSFVGNEFMHIVMSYAAGGTPAAPPIEIRLLRGHCVTLLLCPGGTLHDVIRKARLTGAIPELKVRSQCSAAVPSLSQSKHWTAARQNSG